MASSLGSLVVRLGLDAGDYTSGLVKAEKAAQRFAGETERTMRSASRSTDQLGSSLSYLKQAFAGVIGALGIQELVRLSDEYQTVNARLQIFASSQTDLLNIQRQVFKIAQESRQSLGATADLYYQLANATQDVGTSQKDLLAITTGVNKALILSGSSGSSAKGAIQQLSQALASGIVRGQEFNTLNEQGNRILRALAQGLGKTTGELRQMSLDGQITTDVFTRGFLKGAGAIDEEFKKIPVTVGQALQVAQNALQQFIGTELQTVGQTTLLAKSILFVADNLDKLVAVTLGIGGAKLANIFISGIAAAEASAAATIKSSTALVAKRSAVIAATQAEVARLTATEAVIVAARVQATVELQAAQAIAVKTVASRAAASAALTDLAVLGTAGAGVAAKLAASNAALAAAQAGAGVTARASAGAMALLGGPIGAVTIAIGGAITAWQYFSSKSAGAAASAAASVERSTADIVLSLNKQIGKLRERNLLADAGNVAIAKAGGEGAERAASLLAQIKVLGASGNTSDKILSFDKIAQYKELIEALNNVASEEKRVQERGQRLKAADYLGKLATDAEKLSAELKKAREELGPEFSAEIEKRIRAKYAKKAPAGSDSTQKIFEGQLKAIEAAIAREKDLLNAREAYLQDTYADGNLSVTDYYNNLSSLRAANLRNAIQAYDSEIAATIVFQKKLTKAADRQEAQNKIEDIRAKQENISRDAAIAEEALGRQRTRQAEEYAAKLEELNIQMLELAGNTAKAAGIRFDAQTKILRNQISASGSTTAAEQVRVLREQSVVQAELNDRSKEYALIVGNLDIAQERLAIAQSLGATTQLEASYQSVEINKARLVQLKAIADAYAEIAARSRDPADLLKAEQLRVAFEKLQASTEQLGKQFNDIFANELANGLQDVVTGAKSAKEAFLDMAKSISAAISRIAAQNLAEALFSPKGAGGEAGAFFAKLFGTGSGTGSGGGGFDFGKILSSLVSGFFGVPGGGGGFAVGPQFGHAANGTSFAAGGPMMVGERGPEIVNMPRGSQVTPNHAMKGGGNNPTLITINQTVMPGADTRSARQAANMAAGAVQSVTRRR